MVLRRRACEQGKAFSLWTENRPTHGVFVPFIIPQDIYKLAILSLFSYLSSQCETMINVVK